MLWCSFDWSNTGTLSDQKRCALRRGDQPGAEYQLTRLRRRCVCSALRMETEQ